MCLCLLAGLCVYIYTHTHAHAKMYILTHTHTHIYIHTYIHFKHTVREYHQQEKVKLFLEHKSSKMPICYFHVFNLWTLQRGIEMRFITAYFVLEVLLIFVYNTKSKRDIKSSSYKKLFQHQLKKKKQFLFHKSKINPSSICI